MSSWSVVSNAISPSWSRRARLAASRVERRGKTTDTERPIWCHSRFAEFSGWCERPRLYAGLGFKPKQQTPRRQRLAFRPRGPALVRPGRRGRAVVVRVSRSWRQCEPGWGRSGTPSGSGRRPPPGCQNALECPANRSQGAGCRGCTSLVAASRTGKHRPGRS